MTSITLNRISNYAIIKNLWVSELSTMTTTRWFSACSHFPEIRWFYRKTSEDKINFDWEFWFSFDSSETLFIITRHFGQSIHSLNTARKWQHNIRPSYLNLIWFQYSLIISKANISIQLLWKRNVYKWNRLAHCSPWFIRCLRAVKVIILTNYANNRTRQMDL